MDQEMLQTQLYLNIHPILEKDEKLRKKYVSLLRHFIKQQNSRDLWVKQLYGLYVHKVIGDKVEIKSAELKDLNWIEKFKFFKYRYYLLTDCLFIAAFKDKKKGQAICESIIDFCGERYGKKLSMVLEAFYSEGDETFKSSFGDLNDVYEVIWNNRHFMKMPLRKVMITANMSAGKSTLLNALAGKKVNKTQNDTCTAKIHYLLNKAGEDGLNYEFDHDLELDASLDILMTDNEENDEVEIFVGTRFRSLKDINRRVWLIDTPGVNSSMDKVHREISNNAIRTLDCDILLYLFNGENIGSEDDIKHLQFVKDNYDGRIVFLVNRLDRYKKDVDSVGGTLDSIVNDLRKIGFESPEVFPLSAYAAYLAKMSLYGDELTEDESDDLDFVKRKLKKEEFSYERYYPEYENSDICNSEIETLLLHSGILSLEQLIYS